MAWRGWWRLAWNPLGPLGRIGFYLAVLLALLYILPIPLSLAFNWPPSGSPPFNLPRVLLWTIAQAAASASIAVLAGWPLGILAGVYSSRTARLAVALSFAPFMSPVVVVALSLRSLYGEGGLLHRFIPWLGFLAKGWTGVIALHSYFNIGLAAAVTAAAAASVERSVIEHALTTGLRGPRLWARLLLPATLKPALYAWSLAFLYSYASAGPLMVEGAAYRYYTLEAWLYTLYAAFPSLHGLTAALALLELGLASLVAAALVAFSGAAALPVAVRGAALVKPRGAGRILAVAYPAVILVYLYAPLAALAVEASRASISLLLEASRAGPGLPGAVLNSLVFALVTVLTAVSVGAIVAPSRGYAVLSLTTIAVAPVAYGVTATLSYYYPLSRLIGPIAASALLIVMAHTAVALPLASRVLAASLERLPRELVDYMLTIGLRGAKLLYHTLRAMLPSTAIAAALSATASIGEFGATLVVSTPQTWTLTVLVYHLYSGGRLLPEASLAALILEAMASTPLAASVALAMRMSAPRS